MEFLEKVNEQGDINLNSFILLKDDVVAKEFYKLDKDLPQHLYSVTKSVTSLGIGIARDKGYLNLNDPIISFFPDRLPEIVSENLGKMTVKHLLTMTTGLYKNYYKNTCPHDDWVKAFLALPFVHEPGTHFLYSTITSYMLSAIVEKVTGEKLSDFMYKHLFAPLDIAKPEWECCPMGITLGGIGLHLAPNDLAKIGVLLLNKGEYLGKRIVSKEYLDLAVAAQVVKQNKVDKDKYSGHHYGFQFHVGLGGCYRAHGTFGQLCFVSPKDKIVAVTTSSDTNTEKLLELIYKYILKKAA